MSKLGMRVKNYLIQNSVHRYFNFLVRPTLLLSNTIKLSKWIAANTNDGNRQFTRIARRFDLYSHILTSQQLENEITYLEFGVFKGESIRWWTGNNKNQNSLFCGFDTFEGLPEKWNDYKRGDFSAAIPTIPDERVKFIKGLFQQTLPGFLQHLERRGKLVVHLDADLFSSTMYALTSLAPFLQKDDVLIFDEFNVPNDEFSAFEIFCRSYYIDFELLGATKDYFQIGLKVK